MTTQDMLDERYGRRRAARSRRTTLIAVIAVAAVIVGWFGWYTITDSSNSIEAEATGFSIPDQHSVSVTFQITSPPGSALACIIEADDEQHGIVGWKVVEYPASSAHHRAFTEIVPTVGQAITGLVNTCWVT
ncbi:DUF4307 domain-containing protein [Microbacterium candidum]|uniref:DUF4307 domain-containing protein n=1 Tax=Microbacterium candidum TaxID=3041922 RepID=A0ABT7N233_9MICO|nr:DUF4307 domain-containing protein [Microbacterium sp. ASV49]MDL9980770.1 DUF4307 domain-containing protein [Microbacterium sp. ASV49]